MNTNNENKMTVREAFSLAFGEVPEGATCHIGSRNEREDCEHIEPVICHMDGVLAFHCPETTWEPILYTGENAEELFDRPFGPDISSRPAEAFIGFFGDKYDKVVQP